jgi:DNA polymerase-3 subunit chi
MTTRVTFYDIPANDHLALYEKLARAAWDKRKRLIIRAHAQELAQLDDHLWTFRDESFVPHEVASGDKPLLDEEAFIVLVGSDIRPIPADILLQLAPCDPGFAKAFDTVIDLVDHSDPQRLDASRARYRAWVEAGIRPELKKTL